jgi:hypothetical protein
MDDILVLGNVLAPADLKEIATKGASVFFAKTSGGR